MIRSMFMDGLVFAGAILSVYALYEDRSATNLLIVGVASFALGTLGGRHR